MKIFLSFFLFFFTASLLYSQSDIINTLGTGGIFSIKDGSTTFFSLSQSDGHITLPVTTSPSLGVIFKGSDRFIHDFYPTNAYGRNTFVGINSGNFTMSATISEEASYNTGVGYGTLTNLTTGRSNTATGSFALYNNTTGFCNTAFGAYALSANLTGGHNTAVGYNALEFNTTGDVNTAVGYYSLYSNTTGYNNTALGTNSLNSNTTGFENTALGSQSLNTNSTGNGNIAMGVNALYSNTSGIWNTGLGTISMYSNTIGYQNTAVGYASLGGNTTGYENTAIGYYTLGQNITGTENTAIGYKALLSNNAGFQNTAVGHHSLQNNTGNYNTALGYNAGSTVTTGANLTLIGIDANPSSPTIQNQITLGNTFINSLRCNVQTITSLSDARDKKNIKDLDLGIDFLMKVKPREFNWDKREWYSDNKSDGSKMKVEPTAGFIAQELDQVQTSENAEWLNLVLKDNPEKLEATSGNLLPIIVKAIQDLKKENDELKTRLTKSEQMQNALTAEIEKLESSNNETTKVSLGGQ